MQSVYRCVCVCMCVHACVCVCVCVHACMCVCVKKYVQLSVNVCVCVECENVRVCLSVCLSFDLRRMLGLRMVPPVESLLEL